MECPNCGAYNPESRTQCWKCDELLPTKPEPKKRSDQRRWGIWTWLVIIILGVVWVTSQCTAARRAIPTSLQPPRPPAMAQPLV